MELPRAALRRVASIVGYLALGFVGTAGTALALLYVTRPVQTLLYDAVYLLVGPSEATETAILTHFLAVCATAVGVPLVVGDYLDARLANRDALARGVAALLGLALAFLAASLAGLAAFLTALVVLLAGLAGVPLALRYRYGVRSGGLHAFVGGVPVVVLFLLVVGFGLGWGWGYVAVAQEVPASSVDGPVASFDDAPEVRDDLFAAGNCETDPDGRRVCHLSLRGYDREVAAARFMARHGVRCPFTNAPPGRESGAFVARHDGAYYRVTCEPHGD